MPDQALKETQTAHQRLERAAENLKKIQSVIEPYARRPVVSYPQPVREWKSSDTSVTRVLARLNSK